MERERFAEAVLESLRAHGVTDAEYDAQEFCVRHSHGEMLYLSNVFADATAAAEEEREGLIDHFVTAMTSGDAVPEDWSSARALLRAVLRPVTYGLDADIDPVLLTRPAFPFIHEAVVVDLPRTRAYVTEDMARGWGVEADAVFAAARDNLAAIARPGSPDNLEILRFVDDGDAYFGSWLLVPGWLASYAGGANRPVAFIPDDQTLLVVPDEPELLEQVFGMVEEQYRESARQISPQGYTVDDFDRVVPFDQLGPHPAREPALRARTGLAATEYAVQSRFLEAKFERDLDLLPLCDVEPAFVATVLFQELGGAPVTATIWGEGVEYLLPEADYVHFVEGDPEDGEIDLVCTVPFDAVVQILGLAPLPGLSPTRFEVRQWPDATALSRLREHSIDMGE
ncbi:hypothetical protein HLB23_11760 [Nocardia uniformis]|uniref:DUF1444 family protein n=1 Tax=Nocardia uniformis TaxID=53432 RepID=A0A849C274_9NOCA|nr:hypothetical protein [Nocardia uniformis]NNH70530.1 hypothetical protein [Nocardia uniformis]